MSQDRQPILFVSHPSTKAETATHIERALNARGVRCWMAPRDVEPGEQWDVSIRRAIASTDAMLLLFCEDSERSRQVKRELILADNSDKAIIPVRIERIEPKELSYHLADSQWIDWIEGRDDAIERIAARARELVRRATPPPPDPVPDIPAPDTTYAPPPGSPPLSVGAPTAPSGPNNNWVLVSIAGALGIVLIGLIIWLTVGRAPAQLTAEWFAGTWSDTRECVVMYRFDRSGSVTAPDGQQGNWSIEENNMLVVTGLAGVERRRLEIIADDQVTGPDGNAYRCFGAT